MFRIVLLCGLLTACGGQPVVTASADLPPTVVHAGPPPAPIDVCDPTVTNPYLRRECDRPQAQAVAAEREQAAINACGYQGAIANATMPGSLVRQTFAGLEVQAACLSYYHRTGTLPGQL